LESDLQSYFGDRLGALLEAGAALSEDSVVEEVLLV
jgi:hypothetical protein